MKYSFLIASIILFSSFCSSQIALPDSLRYQAEKDSDFIKLEYKKIFLTKDSSRFEGWKYSTINPKTKEVEEVSIGFCETYNKENLILFKEFVPYKQSQTRILTQFKKGEPYTEVRYIPDNDWDKFMYTGFTGIPPRQEYCYTNFYFYANSGSHRGQPKIEFCRNSNGKYDKALNRYYKNGKIQIKGQYENGKKVGEWIWFKKDGSIKKSKKYT
ncbi:MAG: hypothetical protein COB15_04570 [Flavobacteriales bacterium]|nr:MAG: hypothetical protein COB15_04570 [Flavobacteriales bacterium]